MKFIKKNLSLLPFYLALLGSFIWLLFIYEGSMNRLFVTGDQLGYSAYKKQEYKEAAKVFESVSFKAASHFRAGEFKKAKALYGMLSSKEGRYNTGNSLVMLGKYDDAIKSYELALKIDPDFQKAKENLIVAEARKKLKEVENDGEQGVGQLGADEIKYDNKENKGVDVQDEGQTQSAEGNPQWLDRLQTGPKDFLKNKFAYQYAMEKDAK